MTVTKQDKNHPEINIGSVVKIKTTPVCVGEVAGVIKGRKEWYEVILYDKRLRPMVRGDGTFKRKKFLIENCKLIDETFKFNNKTIEIGDIICKNTSYRKRYGVVVGFTHPDGLLSTSYANGYNGTDLIECIEIEKRGLRRKRYHDQPGELVRFSTFNERVSSCEVDLWNRTGPKIITK